MNSKIIFSLSLVSVAAVIAFSFYGSLLNEEYMGGRNIVQVNTDLGATQNQTKQDKHSAGAQAEIIQVSFQAPSQQNFEHEITAPTTTRKQRGENFTLLVPDRSELQMKQAGDVEKVNYLLANLSPEILDMFMKEYDSYPEGMLKDMGIAKQCTEAEKCHYQVSAGPVLSLGKSFGLAAGDKIIAVNDVSVSIIPTYNLFKDVVFSNNEFMDVMVERNGEFFVIRFA